MPLLSVLDQSPVRSGGTPADAIHESLELAELADRLGYHRYWLAEHHSTPGLGGSSPEVLIGQVAARTSRIRVGAGGVMLQHASALKVAKTFRVLETLFPGRIDLGIGRAPGADHLTTLALEDRGGDVSSEWGTERRSAPAAFPRQVADVIGFLRASFPEGHRYGKVIAMPSGPTVPEVWLLGSSDVSAALAAHFGTAFSFAHFINDEGGAPITRAYAAAFRPSPLLSAPRARVAAFVVCADSEAEALRRARSRGAGTPAPRGPGVAQAPAEPVAHGPGCRRGCGRAGPRLGAPAPPLADRGAALPLLRAGAARPRVRPCRQSPPGLGGAGAGLRLAGGRARHLRGLSGSRLDRWQRRRGSPASETHSGREARAPARPGGYDRRRRRHRAPRAPGQRRGGSRDERGRRGGRIQEPPP